MPTIAYSAMGTRFSVNGQHFDQVVTLAVDHSTKRIRGHAISSGSVLQRGLRKLRVGSTVRLSLVTPEGSEFDDAIASIVMIRTRVAINKALSIFFVFQLKADS